MSAGGPERSKEIDLQLVGVVGLHPSIREMFPSMTEENFYLRKFLRLSDGNSSSYEDPRLKRVVFHLFHTAIADDTLTAVATGKSRRIDTLCIKNDAHGGDVLTGFSDDEALSVVEDLDLPFLMSYRLALAKRMLQEARTMPQDHWNKTADNDLVEAVALKSYRPDVAKEIIRFWQGKQNRFFIEHAISHHQQHFGQVIELLGQTVGPKY